MHRAALQCAIGLLSFSQLAHSVLFEEVALQQLYPPTTVIRLYHSQLPLEERSATCRAFNDGRVDVIVATSGFSVGVHRRDVRLVLVVGGSYGLHELLQMVRYSRSALLRCAVCCSP